MLSYAFQVLNKKQYKKLKTEEFENIAELFSEILIITLNSQIKRGLERDYIEKQDTIPTIHGKIKVLRYILSSSPIRRAFFMPFSQTCEN